MSKTFAVIENNKVVNVVVAETIEDASIAGFVVEYTDENTAAIGWDYDGTNFIPPVIPAEGADVPNVVEPDAVNPYL
jgi:hypothetical protein